jgi:peroxiredoxin
MKKNLKNFLQKIWRIVFECITFAVPKSIKRIERVKKIEILHNLSDFKRREFVVKSS